MSLGYVEMEGKKLRISNLSFLTLPEDEKTGAQRTPLKENRRTSSYLVMT